MKRMTKIEMANEIAKVDTWNPMTIYWDKFTRSEVKEEYDRVMARRNNK